MQTQNEMNMKKMSLCIVFFAQKKNLLDGSLSLSTCGDVCVCTHVWASVLHLLVRFVHTQRSQILLPFGWCFLFWFS